MVTKATQFILAMENSPNKINICSIVIKASVRTQLIIGSGSEELVLLEGGLSVRKKDIQ